MAISKYPSAGGGSASLPISGANGTTVGDSSGIVTIQANSASGTLSVDNTTAGTAKLLSLKRGGNEQISIDASGTIQWGGSNSVFLVAAAGGNILLKGQAADGAGALGCRIGCQATLSNATAELLTLYNDNFSTKKFSVLANGGIVGLGGLRMALRSVAANTSLTTADHVLLADSTGGAVTVTLPAPATAGAGRIFEVKDSGGAALTNNITVARNGSETIDGTAANIAINANYGHFTLTTDGTNWFTL